MTEQIEAVLFASDLTENSRKAFRYAAMMGAYYNVGIILLHVIEKLPIGISLRLAGLEGAETLQTLREAHQRQIRDILIGKKHDARLHQALSGFYSTARPSHAGANIEIRDIVINEGDIAHEIIETAAQHKCGLIVMGAHKGFLGATALGSVTRAVLQKSKVPVLVIPTQDEANAQ